MLKSHWRKYLERLGPSEIRISIFCSKFVETLLSARQNDLPKHLQSEVLRRIHNSHFSWHHGITKYAIFRLRFHFRNFGFVNDYNRQNSGPLYLQIFRLLNQNLVQKNQYLPLVTQGS